MIHTAWIEDVRHHTPLEWGLFLPSCDPGSLGPFRPLPLSSRSQTGYCNYKASDTGAEERPCVPHVPIRNVALVNTG